MEIFYLLTKLYYFNNDAPSDIFLSTVLFWNLGNIIIFFKAYSFFKSFFRISTLFILGYSIVHFQMYIEYLLGNYQMLGHNYLIDERIMNKALSISSLGLLFFLLSYSFFKKPKLENEKKEKYIHNPRNIKLLIYLFFFSFLIFTPYQYYLGRYGRGGVELSYLSVSSSQLLLYSILLYLVIKTINYRGMLNKSISIFAFIKIYDLGILLVIVTYCALSIMSGDRGPLIQILLAFLASYSLIQNKNTSFLKIVLFLIISSSFLTFVAYYREQKEIDNFSEKIENAVVSMSTARRAETFSPKTIELSVSIRAFHAAILYTDNHAHTKGVFQGFQLVSIIPGARHIIVKLTGIDLDNLVSTKFLTKIIQEGNVTHGLGTTCVADIYLDFGTLGVIIFFSLFGVMISYCEYKVYNFRSEQVLILIIFFVSISLSIYLGRSQILTVIKDSVSIYLIYVLLVKKKLKTNKNAIQ